jgi:hypothetical protein
MERERTAAVAGHTAGVHPRALASVPIVSMGEYKYCVEAAAEDEGDSHKEKVETAGLDAMAAAEEA